MEKSVYFFLTQIFLSNSVYLNFHFNHFSELIFDSQLIEGACCHGCSWPYMPIWSGCPWWFLWSTFACMWAKLWVWHGMFWTFLAIISWCLIERNLRIFEGYISMQVQFLHQHRVPAFLTCTDIGTDNPHLIVDYTSLLTLDAIYLP